MQSNITKLSSLKQSRQPATTLFNDMLVRMPGAPCMLKQYCVELENAEQRERPEDYKLSLNANAAIAMQKDERC